MSYANPPQGRNISPHKLINKELIGEGSFGKVYKATWLAMDADGDEVEEIVAIKVMKNATRAQVLQERNRMTGLYHENVVRLRGMVQKDPCPWLVMEYVENGDLHTNILEWRQDGDTLLRISWHIAKGMKYLHTKGIIHGDLAARNVLLGENDVAKIGDLGYYDAQNSSDYYNYYGGGMPCPIRWMSPENLPYWSSERGLIEQSVKKSYEGDVWAFGVVLFELWSRGELPFAGYSNTEVCSFVLSKKKPTHFFKVHMRQHMRGLMHSCWQFDPNKRPKFYRIVQHFERIVGFEPEEDDSDEDEGSDSASCYSSSSETDYY
ncbi:unnamed protein product [Allacma fusca]|uniref:Protein kinase domain-containing protein n=1 Tax=Allacma fusca TaxID=39272 RepID=A0A8J2P2K1_9HEXA|nr:unnamed protein product [Allacma fusca]